MFGNIKKPPKPVIVRKVSVARPADAPSANGTAQRRPLPAQANGSARNGSGAPLKSKSRDAGGKKGGTSTNGHLSVARRQDSKTASPSPSISPSRRSSSTLKRKAQSLSLVPDFGSSSEEDEGTSGGDEGARKRVRPSPRNGTLEPDTKRELLDEGALKEDTEEEAVAAPGIIHGTDLTFGKFKEYNKYLSKTGEDDGEAAMAELQYPSRCARERYASTRVSNAYSHPHYIHTNLPLP